jgi:hypothetical protein
VFLVLISPVVLVFAVVVIMPLRRPGGCLGWTGMGLFDNFIEFAPVEPYTPALRIIINSIPCPSDITKSTVHTGHCMFNPPHLLLKDVE